MDFQKRGIAEFKYKITFSSCRASSPVIYEINIAATVKFISRCFSGFHSVPGFHQLKKASLSAAVF